MSDTIDTTTTKAELIDALAAWIRQRPSVEDSNYSDPTSYRAELRSITKDGAEAKTLLRYVATSQITAEQLLYALRHSFSGRLSWDAEKHRLDYCTGQYWPTEYRRAVCAVLAGAIWDYWRDGQASQGVTDRLRQSAVRTFGLGIASRWFR
jgi:hypothetical protein